MSFALFHSRLANSVILYFAAMLCWSLWLYFRKQESNNSFWGAVIISEILILAQGLLGLILWVTSLRPERGGMHILYAVVGVLGLPLAYSLTKGRQNRTTFLVFGAVYLSLLGIVLRSFATG